MSLESFPSLLFLRSPQRLYCLCLPCSPWDDSAAFVFPQRTLHSGKIFFLSNALLKHQFFQHSWPQQEESKQMELIHSKMRKSASLHGGICFIKEFAWEDKFISNLQNLGNEAKNFSYREETWIFVFFQYLDHNRSKKRYCQLISCWPEKKKIDCTIIKWLTNLRKKAIIRDWSVSKALEKIVTEVHFGKASPRIVQRWVSLRKQNFW